MSAMIKMLLLVLALSAAGAGFSALSLAMDRHWEGRYGRGNEPAPAQRRWLRYVGTAGLLLSLFACIQLWGAVQGWVGWAGVLTAAAIGLVLVLSYAAASIVRIGYGAAIVALGAATLTALGMAM